MNKKIKNRILLTSIVIFIIIIMLGINLVFARFVFPRQVDDVSPSIPCEKQIIDKSDILFVIPIYNNISIANNKTWCREILALNKTLGMHGVYHTYNEFSILRNESYIQRGMEEFKKCFGYYPEIFEAPQLSLLNQNKPLITELNMTIYGYPDQIFHKVYHCSDTGKYSNSFIDKI